MSHSSKKHQGETKVQENGQERRKTRQPGTEPRSASWTVWLGYHICCQRVRHGCHHCSSDTGYHKPPSTAEQVLKSPCFWILSPIGQARGTYFHSGLQKPGEYVCVGDSPAVTQTHTTLDLSRKGVSQRSQINSKCSSHRYTTFLVVYKCGILLYLLIGK